MADLGRSVYAICQAARRVLQAGADLAGRPGLGDRLGELSVQPDRAPLIPVTDAVIGIGFDKAREATSTGLSAQPPAVRCAPPAASIVGNHPEGLNV